MSTILTPTAGGPLNITGTSAKLLDADPRRGKVILQNTGSNVAWFIFDGNADAAAATGKGFSLEAGEKVILEGGDGIRYPLYGISADGTTYAFQVL